MHHGPDPYQRALADLDELLAERDDDLTAWVLDAARQVDRIKGAAQSMVAAAHAVITYGLTDDNRNRLRNSIRHYIEVTK